MAGDGLGRSVMNGTSTTSALPGLCALVGDAPHTWIIVNALRQHFGHFPILLEDGESPDVFWGRRKRLLGGGAVFSQKLAGLAAKPLKPLARKRLTEILSRPGVDTSIPEGVTRVASVNAAETRDHLARIAPRAVFVCSTRMLGAKTLTATPAPFVNYHSGINPAYRGMYGGYFARAQGDEENFGTTFHLVDTGVDTGGILAQCRIRPTRADNFHTYVPLMAAESRETAIATLTRVLAGDTSTIETDLPSRQWYGPTLSSYLWTGLSRGVW